MLYNPCRGHPNIFVHGGGNRAYHPAISVAPAHFCTHFIRLLACPKLVPALLVKIAHNFFFFGAVAGHNIAVGVNKESVKSHIAGQQALLAVYVVYKPVVKICSKPFFRAVAFKKLIDKVFKILCHHGPVFNNVFSLNKIK